MLFNAFLSQRDGLQAYIISTIRRCYDRGGCFKSIKNKTGSKEVNTKKVVQSELETLYTGNEIKSSEVYA